MSNNNAWEALQNRLLKEGTPEAENELKRLQELREKSDREVNPEKYVATDRAEQIFNPDQNTQLDFNTNFTEDGTSIITGEEIPTEPAWTPELDPTSNYNMYGDPLTHGNFVRGTSEKDVEHASEILNQRITAHRYVMKM